MIQEARKLIAFLFQRSGKDSLDENEIYMTLSYELGWLTPAEAKEFIQRGLEQGLLQETDAGYTPTFDTASVDVPLGFEVDGSIVQIEQEDLVTVIAGVLAGRDMHEEQARSLIQKRVEQEHVIPEVAALLVAHEHGVDVQPYLERARKAVKNM
ncbi:MAG: DUF2240 family protein [Candidatus Thermoplasmatota archaeon]|nr:DUF2240 family protein [Candidatus Thermoplasmatota archaeon]